MPSEANPVEAQRLHPVSLVFIFANLARQFLVPALVVLVASIFGREAGERSRYELWAAAFFVPAAITVLVRYFSYRYRLLEDELVINEGIFVRKERHVPYARIQNIDTSQNPFHRWLGVAEATVETASGTEPEARIRVLSMRAIDEMRARIFEKRSSVETAEPEGDSAFDPSPSSAFVEASPSASPFSAAGPEPSIESPGPPDALPEDAERPANAEAEILTRVPLTDLLFLGAFSFRGLAVVGAAFGLLWQFDLLDDDRIEEWFSAFWNLEISQGLSTALVTCVGIALFFCMLILFSMVVTVFTLHGFTLSRRGDELRASLGLFTRRTFTIPRHRIQRVRIEEPWWLRRFGRVSIRVRTAGGGEGASGSRWLVPSLPREELESFLEKAHPEVSLEASCWEPLHRRAHVRMFRLGLIPILGLAIGLVIGLGPWVLLGLLVLVPAAFLWSKARTRRTGYHLGESTLSHRSGVFFRVRQIVPFTKIQAVRETESPFDRRWRMASVDVDVAGGQGSGVAISYLPRAEAARLQEYLSRAASKTKFRW